MDLFAWLVVIIILLLAIILVIVVINLKKISRLKDEKKSIEERFSDVIDIDKEVEKVTSEKISIEKNINELKNNYRAKRVIFDELVREAAIYDESIELAEFGFYKPHFDFDTTEKYRQKLVSIKNEQKKIISEKNAVFCHTTWTIEGSKAKGKTFANKIIKLTTRAFNRECDSALLSVKWNNILILEQRIIKSFEAVNKLNETNNVQISQQYLQLKLNELQITHEYKEKKQKDKEEQAEIRQQMREEAKLQQEIEKAEKDEEKYQKLLEKAKLDAEKATGEKLEQLKNKIESLGIELTEAHEKNERAKSMAQQTRAGHVYVISNIGSFGEKVHKIGMTRRLEPLDRVKELGDASVPFIFDVHAMIYSDDAPTLEKTLHKSFEQQRVNLVNNRKEFFNVNLDDIAKEVKKISPNSEFIETAEARDYRESESIRKHRQQSSKKIDTFPNEL